MTPTRKTVEDARQVNRPRFSALVETPAQGDAISIGEESAARLNAGCFRNYEHTLQAASGGCSGGPPGGGGGGARGASDPLLLPEPLNSLSGSRQQAAGQTLAASPVSLGSGASGTSAGGCGLALQVARARSAPR